MYMYISVDLIIFLQLLISSHSFKLHDSITIENSNTFEMRTTTRSHVLYPALFGGST